MKLIRLFKTMFNYSKHVYFYIIVLFLSLHILYLFITTTNKQITVYEETIHKQQHDDLLIPQTCSNICQLITKLSKNKLNYFLKPIQMPRRLWPNFNADLQTLYNISEFHLPGGSWMYNPNIHNNNNNHNNNRNVDNQEQQYTTVNKEFCETIPQNGVAIIIALKNQFKQLYITLSTLIPILQKQHLCYRIFIIEQIDHLVAINKGKLNNIGFIEALKYFQFKCVIFHAVDLAPINYYNSYRCDDALTKQIVIHLSPAISSNRFKLPYETFIGGVLKISSHHFITVNGYSNKYWGLTNENDDNFEKRLKTTGIRYIHVNHRIGRYIHIPHTSQYNIQSNNLEKLLERSNKLMNSDGLNTLSYKIVSRSDQPFFTHFQVLIKQSQYFY
ncbi:unnamed protein product [Schistosoma turkestanicum]|nr:unnamed protein product [Schistosoma turkestanicum]